MDIIRLNTQYLSILTLFLMLPYIVFCRSGYGRCKSKQYELSATDCPARGCTTETDPCNALCADECSLLPAQMTVHYTNGSLKAEYGSVTLVDSGSNLMLYRVYGFGSVIWDGHTNQICYFSPSYAIDSAEQAGEEELLGQCQIGTRLTIVFEELYVLVEREITDPTEEPTHALSHVSFLGPVTWSQILGFDAMFFIINTVIWTIVCIVIYKRLNKEMLVYRLCIPGTDLKIPISGWKPAKTVSKGSGEIIMNETGRITMRITYTIGKSESTLTETFLSFPDIISEAAVSYILNKKRTVNVERRSYFKWSAIPTLQLEEDMQELVVNMAGDLDGSNDDISV